MNFNRSVEEEKLQDQRERNDSALRRAPPKQDISQLRRAFFEEKFRKIVTMKVKQSKNLRILKHGLKFKK